MAVTCVGGTPAAGSTTATPTMPAGGDAPAAGDVIIIQAESSDSGTAVGTPNTPSGGYSLISETSRGAGVTGVTTHSIWGLIAAGGEGNPTVDGVLNHVHANVFVIKGATGVSVIGDIQVGSNNGADSGTTVTALGITTTVDGTGVLMLASSTRDANTDAFSAWTNAGLSGFAEVTNSNASTNTGAGGAIGAAFGTDDTAGATGDSTVTQGTSVHWQAIHLGFELSAAAATSLIWSPPTVVYV